MIDVARAVLDHSTAVSYGEIVYPPGSTYGPLLQPTVEIGFVHSGSMDVWVDGVRFAARAGSVCLLLPGHRHRFAFAADTETHHSWLHIWSPGGYPRDVIRRLGAVPRVLPLSSALGREIRELLDLRTSRLPTRPEMEVLLAHRMLFQYIGEAELAGEAPGHPDPIDRALRFIDDHLSVPNLDVDEIAAASAVSASHMTRLFREQLGTTPSRYLWDRRVRRGVELLEETGLSVGEIAVLCGFRTSQHFSRRVHETTGATPTLLRDARVRDLQASADPERSEIGCA